MYIPDEVLTVINILEKNDHNAYLVGGCVRDMLLGLKPKDFDICTSARPEKVLELFPGSIPTGIKHGTVTVIIDDLPVEITTFRIESDYTDHRRPDKVLFSDSLTEDLKRRDFTVNAIAYHPVEGIIDPFNGIRDLKDKIIRTVGNPGERFGEDALRMLRAIRLQACYGFSIDNDTFSAIRALSKNIGAISRERILEELNRILLASYPEAFKNLLKTKLLNYIFPIPISETADLTSLKNLPEELTTRWSGLLWLTGVRDAEAIRAICSGLKMSNKLKNEILKISMLLNTRLPRNQFTIRRTLSIVGPESFARAISIMKILKLNKNNLLEIEKASSQIISEKHCLSLSNLAVNGGDLVKSGFKPGKDLGIILNTLFICVLQNPDLNQKDILIQFADIINQKMGKI
ncbi:MAG: CCA tRNA nucleotidyltransferase [Clostridiaceae bacterium]|nr:CCA tRNA nucleotidyltransferase [Clostridiaceae bacterium]